MDEDIDVVAPGLTPTVNIAQIATIWAAEMVAQPDAFEIGDKELVEVIVEAEALVVATEAANNELEEDGEDIEDDDDLMDDDEEIAADLPEEMIFRSDDDVSPYESD